MTTSSCDFFFRSTFNKTGESFLFELISSRNYKQDTYLSVGFSELNVSVIICLLNYLIFPMEPPPQKMSGITVECYTWSATGRVAIDYSFNSYDNIGRNEQIANNSQVAGFTDESVEYADGRLHCQWTVAAQGRVRYNRRGYDFVHQKYYVMLAKGVMASGRATIICSGKIVDNRWLWTRTETRIGRHGHNNIISAKQIDLTKVETIHSGGTSMAIRWHGALMIFGWMGCTTVGILVARFSRDHCPNSTIFGLKVWFQMHRTWMFLGWVAMLASYIIIFVHFGGWTGSTFHTVGGLIAGLLATAQGMNSYLRPAPDSPKRWLFDYGHWFVGNAAHCLART